MWCSHVHQLNCVGGRRVISLSSNWIPKWNSFSIFFYLFDPLETDCLVLKAKPDDTALLGVQPPSPLSSSPSMTHNSINNCSGETTTNITTNNKYATNNLNDITVSILFYLTSFIAKKKSNHVNFSLLLFVYLDFKATRRYNSSAIRWNIRRTHFARRLLHITIRWHKSHRFTVK